MTTVADGAGGFLIQAYPQWYGFGHDAEYWSDVGALEAEAWAQFGRIYFKNDSDVVKMFSTLFPNLDKYAKLLLKGVI